MPVHGQDKQRAYPPVLPDARVEVYKTVDDVELRLWIFEPAGPRADESRAAIVFFFGGGWPRGNPAQFHEHCRYLAGRGMVAMTADYRVYARHGVKPPRCVADAKSAVRWIRAHADRLGVEPASLSPYRHVVPGTPPAIIFHGTADATVPYESVALFQEAMLAHGNRCELVGYQGGGHGFFNVGRDHNGSFVDTVHRMDGFLTSLGYLTPPPTVAVHA